VRYSLPPLALVCEQVHALGVACSIEYPGYLAVPVDALVLNVGTANGEWGADLTTSDGLQVAGSGVVGTLAESIPGDSTDIARIARAIVVAVNNVRVWKEAE